MTAETGDQAIGYLHLVKMTAPSSRAVVEESRHETFKITPRDPSTALGM